MVSAILTLPATGRCKNKTYIIYVKKMALCQSIKWLIPVPENSLVKHLISIQPMNKKTNRYQRIKRRLSYLVRVQFELAKGLNLIMRPYIVYRPYENLAMKPLSSTTTQKRYQPISVSVTNCILNH